MFKIKDSQFNYSQSNKKQKSNSPIKFISCIFLLLIFIYCYYFYHSISYKTMNKIKINNKEGNNDDNEINFEHFEANIFNKIKDRIKGPTLMFLNEYYFINGLIRKYKPKKLLEIGVCSGGMSAVILNAIMDIDDAFLYSCDLEKDNYVHSEYEVGSVVKNNFPEFQKKWKLYTGNTTAAFIEDIGGDIDFVFIDTAHVMPGEVLNMIEIFPFLKKGAIIGFDDIDHQIRSNLYNTNNFYPCNNLLFSILRGKKIIPIHNKNTFNFKKIGAVILDDNQERYYFEYFYLLTNIWSYMPNKFEIILIRNLISKYYKPFYLSIFDNALAFNYDRLNKNGLLKKDYILYTFQNSKRKKPFSSYL